MTSDEIRNTTFEKSLRGYKTEDVDAFLSKMAGEIDVLEAHKTDLDGKMRILAQKVEEYRGQEETLKTAMINAQRMGETVVYEAHQRAETLLREAEGQSDLLRQQAEREYEAQRKLLDEIRGEVSKFRQEILAYYTSHLDNLSRLDDLIISGENIAEKFPEVQGKDGTDYGKYLSNPDEPIIPSAENYSAAPFGSDETPQRGGSDFSQGGTTGFSEEEQK